MHVKYDTGMGQLGTRDPAEATAVAGAAAARGGLAGRRDDPLRHRRRARRLLRPRSSPPSPRSPQELFARYPGIAVHAANTAGTLRQQGRGSTWSAAASRLRDGPRQRGPGPHGWTPRWCCGSYVAALKPARARGLRRLRPPLDRRRANLAATVPIGYGDGWRRALTSKAATWSSAAGVPPVGTVHGQHHGRRRPGPPVAVGDEVADRDGGARPRPGRGGWARSTTRSPAGSRPGSAITPRTASREPARGRAGRRSLGAPRRLGGRRRPARPRCSGATPTTSTSPSRRRPPPARALARPSAARRSRSPRRSAAGACRPGPPLAGRPRRCGGSVEADLARATSPSTRWPSRSAAAPRRPVRRGAPTSPRAACGCRAEAFADDPLRVLRLARLACELGLDPEAETARAAAPRGRRSRVAAERVFAELGGIVLAAAPVAGSALLRDVGRSRRCCPSWTR